MQQITTHFQRRCQGARRYANFDKSDPHTYKRAVSHILSGICEPFSTKEGGKNKLVMPDYDADTYPAHNPIDDRWAPLRNFFFPGIKKEAPGTAYKNICRP